jgi:hypothetical protein
MDTVTYLTLQWGMLLAITSRVPEAKLLILRVSEGLKEVYNTPHFRTHFQVVCLESVSWSSFYPRFWLESVSAFTSMGYEE